MKRTLLIFALSLFAAAALLAQPDPGSIGPFAVSFAEYTYGDTAFNPPGFPGPVELTARVHYPSILPGSSLPLIIILHGRHATCFQGRRTFLEWPCAGSHQPIPSYQGYDYLANQLASHANIVVSISANGISAQDNNTNDLGMQARAQLIQRHLDQWKIFNTTGGDPFGNFFVGKVNLSNVGTLGHSRGGEGVVTHLLLNQSLGSPYGVKAVFALAPVDFNRPVPNGVPFTVMLPYCDGDVSDQQGVHFYDDARYSAPTDNTNKHSILVMGANHNFYNTIWTPGGWPAGAIDDWRFVSGGRDDSHCGQRSDRRLEPAEQQGTLLAYGAAFFRVNIIGESIFLPYLKGDIPAPPSAMTNDLFVSYHAGANGRLDVNRLLDATNLTTNTLGGAAVQTGVTPYTLCGGEAPQPASCYGTQSNARQPHTTPSARSPKRGLSQLRSGWLATSASYENAIPVPQGNVSGFAALTFRVSVDPFDGRNAAGQTQDFTVTLHDAAASASVVVSSATGALYYPPGDGNSDPVPKLILNTVRIPLSRFSGVNLSSIQKIHFKFDQKAPGAFMISDIGFAN